MNETNIITQEDIDVVNEAIREVQETRNRKLEIHNELDISKEK
ncbi:hypothetical protein [Niallia nealsonii]|nr:hypothetical protein [Niallia nealsonii]